MNTAADTIYLDHSATTPVDPRVVEAMAPYWNTTFGNTESSHAVGRAAAGALEQARQTVATILDCRRSEIVFTGSGTESDNLALRGAAWAAREGGQGSHILTTPIEHHGVGRTLAQLQDLFGFSVEQLPVNGHGLVDPDDVASAIRSETILVSVILANNEIGTIQPAEEIGRICRDYGVLFHTDAVQAPGRLPLRPVLANADLMAISAHKFYGPKGVGLLFVRQNTPLIPPITGGDHERSRRPGTVNVAGAVGLAAALRIAEEHRRVENAGLLVLRDRLIEGILETIPACRLTGHPDLRLPHHASFVFRGVEGESIVQALDMAGIAASSGAACAEGEPEPSFVLKALGLPLEWGIGSLRLSLGRSSTEEHVNRVLSVLPKTIEDLREAQ
jgi:cysteine desulfurase